jgi:hypothetical protein
MPSKGAHGLSHEGRSRWLWIATSRIPQNHRLYGVRGQREIFGAVRIQPMLRMSHNTPGGYRDPGARTTSGEDNPVGTVRVIASIVRSI